MSLHDKWCVKTGFTFALQFFMLISDNLGGVSHEAVTQDSTKGYAESIVDVCLLPIVQDFKRGKEIHQKSSSARSEERKW